MLQNWKPARGEALLERKDRRKELEAAEDTEKVKVRIRDFKCRYPFCPFCAKYKNLRLEVAHVIQAKGMSGDRTLERSQAHLMMRFCFPIHDLQEKHDIRVDPLTDEGTFGPCEFWRRDGETGAFYLVAREIAPFRYERD